MRLTDILCLTHIFLLLHPYILFKFYPLKRLQQYYWSLRMWASRTPRFSKVYKNSYLLPQVYLHKFERIFYEKLYKNIIHPSIKSIH